MGGPAWAAQTESIKVFSWQFILEFNAANINIKTK
jgi:hypothetical protein